MISPKPNTPAWSVLALVVAHPGELDAESIGQRLWRPKLVSTADYLRVRALTTANGPEWSRRASGILSRLTSAGLVERQRGPVLSGDIPQPDRMPCASMHKAAAWALDTLPNGSDKARQLLADLVRLTPGTLREWVGPAPNGATQRAVSSLYEAGIVVPPSFRWPTAEGIALIEGGA